MSGSGEAWGRGVPPRHFPTKEELIGDGTGGQQDRRGALEVTEVDEEVAAEQ